MQAEVRSVNSRHLDVRVRLPGDLRGFEAGLRLLRAEDAQAFVHVRRHVVTLSETGLAPQPLITGDDLIAHGLSPGPHFKRVLDAVYDAQLEGSISTAAA